MRYVLAAFGLLIIANAYHYWTRPRTSTVTACWTAADGDPICRGAIRRDSTAN